MSCMCVCAYVHMYACICISTYAYARIYMYTLHCICKCYIERYYCRLSRCRSVFVQNQTNLMTSNVRFLAVASCGEGQGAASTAGLRQNCVVVRLKTWMERMDCEDSGAFWIIHRLDSAWIGQGLLLSVVKENSFCGWRSRLRLGEYCNLWQRHHRTTAVHELNSSAKDKSCRQDFRSFAIPLQMLRKQIPKGWKMHWCGVPWWKVLYFVWVTLPNEVATRLLHGSRFL